MTVRSGKMRHRVRIEERSSEQDASGQQLRTWTLVGERWASVEPMMGREFFASGERTARAPVRFRMRYFEKVKQRMRLVYDGRVYDIRDIQVPDGIKHEMVVVADEWVSEVP